MKIERLAIQSAASATIIPPDYTAVQPIRIREGNASITWDPEKCLVCGACERACRHQGIGAFTENGRGTKIAKMSFHAENCVGCGQCTKACKTGALTETKEVNQVMEMLGSGKFHSVVQIAPALRVGIAKEFGIDDQVIDGVTRPAAEIAAQKLYSAFRVMGFDGVLDTNFAADVTIIEEGGELLNRLLNDGVTPMFTSCCPAWVKLVKKDFPDLIPNLSTCMSPQQMEGALIKTYYAGEKGIKPEDMRVVSFMPCTAKKSEAKIPELNAASRFNQAETDTPDVDFVLTARELKEMLEAKGIDLKKMPLGKLDSMLGEYTGSAAIFGRTGGVMRAALRYAYYKLTGERLMDMDLDPLPGHEAVKRGTVKIGDKEVKVMVVSGGENCRQIAQEIQDGKHSDVHFIEFMDCPDGCVNGGGQFRQKNLKKNCCRISRNVG